MKEKTEPQEDAGVRFPPPLVFLGFALLGWTAERRLGSLPSPLPDWLAWAVGALVASAGILLIAWALGRFRAADTPPEPWRPSAAIARDGIYARTRNPMYLGMTLVILAAAIGLQSPGILIGGLIAFLVIDRFVVRREEAYLLRRFGDSYAAYKAGVRRWL